MKKRKKPRYYIILMLVQPLIFAWFFVLGTILDSKLWETADAAQGHPAPVFSLLLPSLGAVICLITFLIAVIGLIVCLRRRRKGREKDGTDSETLPRRCPCCGRPAQDLFCGYCGEKLED